MYSLVVDEAIMEALESDGLTLQNMSNSKVVASNPEFKSTVTSWQKKLNAIDSMLTTWIDVQKKWSSLESIFCGSADIRSQLPEQSLAFDDMNSEYKDIMRSAPLTTNAMDACSIPHRLDRLQHILVSLESIERALQSYLETKRVAFPRFYFVSPADLLDILARGADPHSIERHISKLFDNLHRLEWKREADTGAKTRIAVGMYSGEGEYVPFAKECHCGGPPEVWLARVVDAMRAALRAEYDAAYPAYEDKPRVKWLFDWSAQTATVVSRTYFTQEVNDAFSEMERGNEDALKAVYRRQCDQLSELITTINGPLSK